MKKRMTMILLAVFIPVVFAYSNNELTAYMSEIEIVPSVVLLGSLIMNAYLAYKVFYLSKQSNIKNDKYQPFYTSEKNALNKKIEKLELKIEILEQDEKERETIYLDKDLSLEKNKSVPEELPENSHEDDISIPISLHHENSNQKVFYLPSPFEENKFSKEDSSEIRTATSLYEINYNSNTYAGHITLIQNADFKKALNSPDLYLEKACIYDNAYNINATRVEVTQKGEVELDGDDWLVTKKLRIKFS